MANLSFPPASSLDNPVVSAASSSSGAPVDDFEDACCICLEPFTTADPATITGCKHEYHLHCILEWSERSEDCPICCQFVVLKDTASQGLLAAVQIGRQSGSKDISSTASAFLPEVEEDEYYSDDSDFDERLLQHLGAARVCDVPRRVAAGIGPSQVLPFTFPVNMSQQIYPTSPANFQNLDYVSPEVDTPSGILSAADIQTSSPVDVNLASSRATDRDVLFKPRLLHTHPPSDSSRRPNIPEMFSFSETLKSKFSAASARYKESISNGTRGFKEKLLAHNNSVKELSKGVQREMTAGIAGVTRIIERLDLIPKRTGSSVPVSSSSVGPSNLSFREKDVEDNVDSQSLQQNGRLVAVDSSVSAAALGHHEIPHPLSGC